MSSPKKPKNSLWYKYLDNASARIRIEGNLPSSEEEPTVSDIKKEIVKETDLKSENFTLKIKRPMDIEYEELNEDLFNNCGNNYNTLRVNFNITKDNPIIVNRVEVTTSENNRIQELEARLAVLQINQGTSSPAVAALSTSTGIQAQAPSDEIHVRYNNQTITFKRNILEAMRVSNVANLIDVIKFQLPDEKLSDKVVTLRREVDILNSKILISELYNTRDSAFEVVINERGKEEEAVGHTLEHVAEFKFASIAFNRVFEDKSESLNHFQQYINECHRKSEDTYMPYLTILQSSGYGKSRLIKEYANNVYTLYLNLGIDMDCFPRPSADAKDFISSFENSRDPATWFNTFLAKAISSIKENNYSNPSQFWESQLNDNGKSIWKPAIDAANETNRQGELESIRTDAGYLEENFENVNSEIRILLCIDEGRTLLEHINNELHISLFRCWRRALRENKWRARGLFSVILDTTSRLSNFAPSLKDDPTIKALNDSRKIFMPFIDVTTFNTLTGNTSDSYYNRLFSNGRPCWKALKDAYCEGNSSVSTDIYAWNKVINLAKAKIQGGDELLVKGTNTDEEKKNLTSVAILASLCSVDISPSVHFASNLIGSHLGTCLSISQDRMKVLVCYPSEPLITEAVYGLLNHDILHRIAQTLGQGVVEPGKRGEIVGELILILTRQSLQTKKKKSKITHFFAGEIELMDFLNELLLDSSSILDGDNVEHNTLKNANISFTRFVTISTIPTKDDLTRGYETGVAFNLKRNQKGADFLIPVRIIDEYTFWIIQIKNHNLKTTNSDFKTDATSKLTPKYVFEKSDLAEVKSNYLAMYWQLGAHEKGIQDVDWGVKTRQNEKNPNPTTHYAFLGLKSFKVARGKILESLRAILSAYINPYDKMWSNDPILGDRTDCIETFLPWCPSKPNEKLLLDKYNDTDV